MTAAPSPDPTRDTPLLVAFAPFAIWSPHFETDLEIVQDHLDAGGRALVLSCEGQLRTCEPNPAHRAIICALCRRRFRKGMEWLQGDRLATEPFLQLEADEAAAVDALGRRRWNSLDELREYRLDGSDIGLAAVSSVVSMTREPSPDAQFHHNALAANLASAAMVHFSLRRKLANLRPDTLSLFNGRFAALRPALRTAQALGIEALVHERAGDNRRYSKTLGTYPHDIAAVKHAIECTYLRSGGTEPARLAAMEWYEERRRGIAQAWVSFTAAQDPFRLPEGFRAGRVNVVIFISSEDEFVAIEEWDNPFYPDQNEGVARLVAELQDEPGLHFFLRVHPNLAGLLNSQVRGIQAIATRFGNLTVIPADSPVSTYALMDAADLVISYGSTVGIEAAYAGKPSILMGRAMYEDLGVCVMPRSHAELVGLLRSGASGVLPRVPGGHRLGLEKFGHFNRAGGHAFQHVVPDGLHGARMLRDDGQERLGAHPLVDLVHKAVNLLGRWRKAMATRRDEIPPQG